VLANLSFFALNLPEAALFAWAETNCYNVLYNLKIKLAIW